MRADQRVHHLGAGFGVVGRLVHGGGSEGKEPSAVSADALGPRVGKLSGQTPIEVIAAFLDQLRGLFGLAGWNWLGEPSTVMSCLIVMVIWKEAGFFMIFYLAALQQLSPDLEEAAAVEGASRWYTFRRITFPLLMPTTLFVAINAVINSFKLVDHLVIMTKGGPNNASTLLLYYIYEVAFTFQDSAYAATLTVVLLVLLSTVAVIKFGYLDRRIHYQ